MYQLLSLLLLFALQTDIRPAKRPGDWEQIKSLGIVGEVSQFREARLQKMNVAYNGQYTFRWDTLSLLEYHFDNRGNLISHTFAKRRPENRSSLLPDKYSVLQKHLDESYSYDDGNNIISSRTLLEDQYITETWAFSGMKGTHTRSIDGENTETQTIEVTASDGITVVEYRDANQCITRRYYTDADYDSTVFYNRCGTVKRLITANRWDTADGISVTTRMSFSGGLWSGSVVKAYNGRIMEEQLLSNMGTIAEQTIYTYDKRDNLVAEMVFDHSGTLMKKITTNYDEQQNKTEEVVYGTGRDYEWKTIYVNSYDGMQKLVKQVSSTTYPGKKAETSPPITRLFLARDSKNNVLQEMAIFREGSATDSAMIVREIVYHQ